MEDVGGHLGDLDMSGAGAVLGNEITGRVGLLIERIADLELRLERSQVECAHALAQQGSYAAGISRLTKERAAMLRTVGTVIEAIKPTAPELAVDLLKELFGHDGSGYATYAPDGEPAGSTQDFVTGTWVVGYERAMTALGRMCRSVETLTEPALDLLTRIAPVSAEPSMLRRAKGLLEELRETAERTLSDPFTFADPEPVIEDEPVIEVEVGWPERAAGPNERLYQKYAVSRMDRQEIGVHGCIVLEIDDAKSHPALLVWAATMEATGRPYLADDVRKLVRMAMLREEHGGGRA